jgi:uncharacterized membrane protein
MQTLMLFYMGGGFLLAALALPMARRQIKPNGLYGFRNKATQENPELWYKVNEYAGRRLLTAGIGTVLTALLLAVWPGLNLTVDEYALAVTGVVGGLLLWAILTSYLYLRSQQ